MHCSNRLVARCVSLATKRIATNNNHLRGSISRTAFRSFSNDNATNTDINNTVSPSLDEAKSMIFESALNHVHEYGWTEQAITEAVLSLRLPLSMMGMITPNDLITHFMDDCHYKVQHELDSTLIPQWKQEGNQDLAGRLETVLRMRLEYVVPFVKSNTWHEGMALGATNNTTITASQLDRMVQSIADAIVVGTNHAPLAIVERTAIGALYVSTELHLLADESDNHEATWAFLKSRIGEMQLLAQNADWNSVATGDTAVAASAVANSLGGAVVSLLQPAARGAVSAAASTVVPFLATFLQPPVQPKTSGDGTRASDYDAGVKPPSTAPAEKSETPSVSATTS